MVITLREGGETSLILALLFSSLKAARHAVYRVSAWIGFALALALSVLAGVFLQDLGALGPLFEGTLAWIGAGFIASLAVQLHWNAADYRSQLASLKESASADRASWTTAIAIGSFAFVSVIREGLETAVFLANGAALRSEGSWLGAGVGLALAAAFGVAIYLGFRRLNIRAFMRTTEILLFALVFSLFLSGLHEFGEAGLLAVPRPLELFHLTWVRGGHFLQALLCAAPFLYLALARGPVRYYWRAAGVALLLALVPISLGAAAGRWEHARLAVDERERAVAAEQRAQTASQEMVAALETLRNRTQAQDVDGARDAWIEARRRFVQLEPLLVLAGGDLAEALNGEPGEAAGFHGVEAALFTRGAPWASDAGARASLLADESDLLARSRVALGTLDAFTLDPATVRQAWTGHRWTLAGRLDGQESGASQTSILEWSATLDAMDADLGGRGFFGAPIREALSAALAQAAAPPRFGDQQPEWLTTPEQLHAPVPLAGPDRVWDLVDRERLRRAIDDSFARIESDPLSARSP